MAHKRLEAAIWCHHRTERVSRNRLQKQGSGSVRSVQELHTSPVKRTNFKNFQFQYNSVNFISLFKIKIYSKSLINFKQKYRCAQKIECFSDKSVVVSPQSIEDAIDWLNSWVREFESCITDTTTVEATAFAFKDKTVAKIIILVIYFFESEN